EPGSERWKGHNNAWQTGGGSMWVTGSYHVATDQVIWGTGNPVPGFDANYRPGDNLFTSSAISWNPNTGVMNWYFQYTPGGMWDYDATGPHLLLEDKTGDSPRKLVVHAGRNGFLYALERDTGQVGFAKPHMEVTWTSGIDQRTGKPLDYDPARAVQTYAGIVRSTGSGRGKAPRLCPSTYGGANFWPPSYSHRTKLLYIPVLTG